MPDLAREPCAPADLPPPPHPTPDDFRVHAALQVGQLEVCDRKRGLGVEAADLHNRYVDRLVGELRPPTIFERITGKRLVDPMAAP